MDDREFPWEDWTPIKKDWDGTFRFMHLSNEFSDGKTILVMSGVTKTHHSIVLKMHGFEPYCWLGWNDEKLSLTEDSVRTAVARWEIAAKSTAADYFGDSSWHLKKLRTCPRWVTSIEAQTCDELGEDDPRHRRAVRYKISFVYPALVKMFKQYVLYQTGRDEDPYVPSFWGGIFSNSWNRALIYEGNLDFSLRCAFDMRWTPCGLLKVDVPRADRVLGRLEFGTYDEFGVRCDVFVQCDVADVHTVGKVPSLLVSDDDEEEEEEEFRLRVCAFDIETAYEGKRSPEASKDPILCICVSAYEHGKREGSRTYAFCLGSCGSDAADCVTSYETEQDMLSDFYAFLVRGRFDVVIAHNGNGFDWPYLVNRAKALRLAKWNFIGVVQSGARAEKPSTFNGKTTYKFVVPHVVVADTMIIESRTYGSTFLGLNFVSNRYLKLEKIDLNYEQLTHLSKSHEGRTAIARYCTWDAELVRLVELAQDGLNDAVEFAKLSIPMQLVLSRGLGVKLEGAIARACLIGDVITVTCDPAFRQRSMFGRLGVQDDSSAYQGRKGYEGAVNLRSNPIYVRWGIILWFDFAGLYPSIMRAYNISPDTLVRRDVIKACGYVEGVDYVVVPNVKDVDGEMVVGSTENSHCFLTPKIRVGIITIIQRNLAAKRQKAKDMMRNAKTPEEKSKYKRKEKMIKTFMNSIYGLFGRTFSSGGSDNSRYISKEVAESITAFGRYLLLTIRKIVKDKYGDRLTVIAGDTDSIGVQVNGDLSGVVELGFEIAKLINDQFPKDIRIVFEKMATHFIQSKKKNYAGRICEPVAGKSVDEQAYSISVKGSWTRRNVTVALKRTCSGIANLLFSESHEPDDVVLSAVLEKVALLTSNLRARNVPVGFLIESTKIAKDICEYADPKTQRAIAGLQRRYEADLKAGRHCEKPAAGDVYRSVVVPGVGGIATRTISAFEAIKTNAAYDVEYYVEQAYRTISTTFGAAFAELTGVSSTIERDVDLREARIKTEFARIKSKSPAGRTIAESISFAKLYNDFDMNKHVNETRSNGYKKAYADLLENICPRNRYTRSRLQNESTGVKVMNTFFDSSSSSAPKEENTTVIANKRIVKRKNALNASSGGTFPMTRYFKSEPSVEKLEADREKLKTVESELAKHHETCLKCMMNVFPKDRAEAEIENCVSYSTCEVFAEKHHARFRKRHLEVEIERCAESLIRDSDLLS